MKNKSPGRRVYQNEKGELWLAPGDYGYNSKSKAWECRPPIENCHGGNLAAHEVKEHIDGTISVTPSIYVNPPGERHNPKRASWHGYLIKGDWYEC